MEDIGREYLLGLHNSVADCYSYHLQDSSDWQLDTQVLQMLVTLWGPLQVDLLWHAPMPNSPILLAGGSPGGSGGHFPAGLGIWNALCLPSLLYAPLYAA